MRRWLVLCGVLFALQSCSTMTYKEEFAKESEANMYAIANQKLQDGQYHGAAEFFTILNTRYPFSEHAERNRVAGIYSQFMDRNYTMASAEAAYFVQLYPRSKQAPWAWFIQAYSQYKLYRTWYQEQLGSDRARNDLSSVDVAYQKAQYLIDFYPNSRYTAAARALQQDIRAIHAEEDIEVADFYKDRGVYVASAKRAETVLTRYNNTCFVPQSLTLLANAYAQLGLDGWVKDVQAMQRANNWPETTP
jgi:outer membrane protein assembly factor BamD